MLRSSILVRNTTNISLPEISLKPKTREVIGRSRLGLPRELRISENHAILYWDQNNITVTSVCIHFNNSYSYLTDILCN